MAILRGVQSECIKLRHTAISWLHLIIPLVGAAVFSLYFLIYSQVTNDQKMALVLELTASIFPIIISVICGMMVNLEEKAGNFQVMLSNKNGRIIPYFSKLITAVMLGGIATTLLVSFTLLGLTLISTDPVPYGKIVFATLGMYLGSIPLYVIYMFISIKWGLGSSVFVGVIGCLVSIMFSNVNVGTWVIIPFAWGVKILQNFIHITPISLSSFSDKFIGELGIIVIITLLLLLLSFLWFHKWEGRKTFE